MDFGDYRRRWQKLVLSPDGRVPEDWGEAHSAEESQNAILSTIASLWDNVRVVYRSQALREFCPQNPTVVEIWKARKRWMLSHDLFLPLLSLVAHGLEQAVTALRENRRRDIAPWARRAAEMREGCGSLFRYSVDFAPCTAIYCGDIRADMPPGFSGYEIRERQFCSKPAIAEFLKVFRAHPKDDICAEAVSTWVTADRKYNEEHIRCMKSAVPVEVGRTMPESLLQRLAQEQGGGVPACEEITEKRFREYDLWFAIERRTINRMDFALQVCEVIERIVADLLLRGHRLETEVLENLVRGMRAALMVFAAWTGPIQETSPFFSKAYRGE